jgi:hypothetical protein
MIAVQDVVAVPVRWDVGMDTGWWRLRYRSIAEASIACIAGMHDVAVCHPLTDSFVVSAIAREGGRVGFPSRTAAMQHIVGDLLPEQVTARTSKAALTGAFWNRYSTAFAASWERTGVDPEIVDVEVLHRMWTAAEHPPDARTFPLLQSSWLASRPLADTESSG